MNLRCTRTLFLRLATCLVLALVSSHSMVAVASANKPGTTDSISLSATSYDFGLTFVRSPLTRAVATVTNTGGGTVKLNPAASGDTSFEVVTGGCGRSLAAGASCAIMVDTCRRLRSPREKQPC